MSDVIISVENLGKCYRINHQQSGPKDGLRHVLNDWVSTPLRMLRTQKQKSAAIADSSSEKEDFWALRDVSFEIKRGEVVGIVGRNGAGKSTLLKILSRITEPTVGRVRIKGRVASLLEVGTGFHPELTGRENIYLNGAILGMSRAEIKSKFDEIVTFSEVEKFLDTPVKRYSSGMYVRLAFAVAAHLEPEILIVDEVLAVGDIEFQKKCLGKMQDVSKGGRTVLFVSHNMGAVQSLCNRGIMLQKGGVVMNGTAAAAVSACLDAAARQAVVEVANRVDRSGTGASRLQRITFGSETKIGFLTTGRPAWFHFTVNRWVPNLSCSFALYTKLGVRLAHFTSRLQGPHDQINGSECNKFICEMQHLYILPGGYRLNAALHSKGELLDHVETAVSIEVEPGEVEGRRSPIGSTEGELFLPHIWKYPSIKFEN